MAGDMILKDFFKKTEKELIQQNKKYVDFLDTFKKIDQIYQQVQSIKSNTQISKSYMQDVKKYLNNTKTLETMSNFYNVVDELSQKSSLMKNQVKEMKQFLEKFRTTRIYSFDSKNIYRFFSGFLEGYSEYFYFKPEFIGIVNLDDFAKQMKCTKEGTRVKFKYEVLPKLVLYAYKNKLKNFVVETHNLKFTFLPNFKVKVVSENSMIKKIDRVAKENNLFLEN